MKPKRIFRGFAVSVHFSFVSAWAVGTPTITWSVLMPVILAGSAYAASAPPTSSTVVGDTVKNPVTGLDTIVTGLILDPDAAPGDPTLAFVKTADGNVILVKNQVGNIIYNNDSPPIGFKVTATDAATKIVTLQLASDANAPTATFSYAPTLAIYQENFFGADTPGTITPSVIANGADGVRNVQTGQGGSNGRDGALVVPPTSGGNGAGGPMVTVTNSLNISATKIGVEAGSIGGAGGNGGDSYASFWSGRDGGDGGAGGTVNLTNSAGFQVSTSGDNNYGLFGYSRSGAAGSGGGGFGAPGGGTGGHSSNGGSVNITNNGDVITSGDGAFGIYGLSVSNNGGGGGNTWGIVGQSGSGGFGGSGGAVTIVNNGTIQTSGNLAHGILGQSIGGSGGSSGTSGNLLLSLNGSADNGGNGGTVQITNTGGITTLGNDSRGIIAQSIGGGGGSGGSSGGLIALGGSGSNGGSGSTVTVSNTLSGVISTSGLRSDGIFAQSIGGSGGSGSDAGGLIAIGGSGSKAGNGGAVTVENYGTISTKEDFSRGIVAQSIGGGGGDGGNTGGVVSVGGSGAGGGSSSTVTIKNGGNITTLGNDAWGILGQSIGGGGGNGGSSGSVGLFAGLSIGGTAGGGGAGGNVDITLQGNNSNTASVISTGGDRSTGLFAQSVGGGGGTGGGAVQVSVGAGAAVSIAVGGQGGLGGAGGTLTLSPGSGGISVIETGGNDSTGAMIQSVGGGGGNGGYSIAVAAAGGPVSGALSVSVGGSGAIGGTGGTVSAGTFDSNGNLITSGFNGSIFTSGGRSTGFIAQSVGGGGGNGGLAVAGSASTSLLGSASVAVGVGGAGAGGGEGGKVSLGYQGNITTEGSNSSGLIIQSVGGGGGNGGGSIAASVTGSPTVGAAISVGIGGAAGAGSAGGEVIAATRSGQVTTKGDNSTGIIVQSVGGGGGNGGYNVSASLAGGAGLAGSINVGLGGTAGGGGNGGAVRADLQSDVLTSSELIPDSFDPVTGEFIPAHYGQNSGAILVQSVGGGGGNGGFNISAGAANGGGGSAAVSVGLGGTGGSGGTGGVVNASSTGILWTQGDNSSGFIAQSIGGGGGNGGYNVSAGAAASAGINGSVGIGIGGKAGSGNNAGSVTAITSLGTITTIGDNSFGVLAQSVGGGGGNGGFNVSGVGSASVGGGGAIAVGLGGSGGAGGLGGTVNLTVDNDVSTFGKNSSAVVAQSIGGGGGNGGFNVSGALSASLGGSGAIAIGLGGAGFGGGNGGVVTATVDGNIITLGDSSFGILAQSVGGGGGNGGFNVSGSLSAAGGGSGAVSIGLGGSGGIAGNGGQDGISRAVTLNTSGSVITQGSNATGIVAQSIGGGGGNGGFNVSASLSGGGGGSAAISVGLGGSGGTGGIGKDVYARLNSAVTTSDLLLPSSFDPVTGAIIPAHYATDSTGILVQSVGGGGGNGGFNVSGSLSGSGIGIAGIAVGLGGNGGTGGLGGNIDAQSTGEIVTRGDRSSGIVLQSLGGGGGNGGFNVSGSLSGGLSGAAISVGLGGTGGTGNHSGEVLGVTSGNVWTYGHQSTGVLAQSVGGGGGNGGFNVSGGLSIAGGSGGVGVGLGGSGGGAGNASLVNLTVNNTVYTQGNQSVGVLGQSVGGGGGNGGFNVTAIASGGGAGSGAVAVGLGGDGGGGGNAGAVTVSTTGNIETLGEKSGGIIAQSVGGGGGNGGYNVTVSGSGAGTGSGAVAVGLGGSGSGGGFGSTVDLTVRNTVKTTGEKSSGIVAQSIGGGGGNGAFDISVAGSGAGTGSGALSVSLGGNGGTGNYSDTVTSDVIGNIQTSGNNSLGFISQSIGGGGGNGAFSVSTAISGAGKGSAAGAVSLGGSGGDGGYAGKVISSYAGNITTSGEASTGIVSQSVGGGGGNGSYSLASTFSAAKNGSFAASFGMGGSGGSGNYADTVNNTVVGTVVTSNVLIPDAIDPVTGLLVPAHFAENSGGILAQSLGGGGGNGGFNVSGAVSLAQNGSGALSIGIGGSGGAGGYAQKVTNHVTGDVFTSGKHGFGIAAQSIGGGGGNGGMNVTGAIAAAKDGSGALGIGIGGFGGDAAAAGDVDNTVIGYVQTLGHESTGILAQSLGGGGGNGGMNVTGVITAAKTGSGNVGFGLGGFGGGGGDGAVVMNRVTGGTVTVGNNSQAIVAQSLGGGGGNGGMNVTGTVNITKENGGTVGIGIGGFGGDGGSASNVTSIVKTTTDHNWIETSGNNSSAVVAQSIGGGGGGGGLNVTGAVNITGKNGAAIGLGLGGFGGGAGNSGVVTADVTGNILTRGDKSHGLLAQSIGGAGGNGGTNITGTLAITNGSDAGKTVAASIGVGGFGGGGGTAGAVDVKFSGNICALSQIYIPGEIDPDTGIAAPGDYVDVDGGEGSNGLVAQSIGGGGGNGGLNVSGGIAYARGEGDGYGIVVGVGGFGGAGGSAEKVDVLVSGEGVIRAYGGGHSAILAQSIGGGGGNGATNVSGGIVSDSSLIVGVGGFGGNAGVSKDVTVTSNSDLSVDSADYKNISSAGIMAQSLGGGGGNGGLNVSGGLALNKSKDVPTITVGVGGFGGAGAISGDVNVNQTGNISTVGNWIHGIMAQSIAGGGGNGGMNVSGQINFADSDNSGGKTDLTVVAGIGGNGGAGADAGDVIITNNGFVTTKGDHARGVAAQSIGGGGGTGGMNIGGVFAKNSSPIIVGVGGSGSGGGHAGSATVIRGTSLASTGKVTTDGVSAYGIEASSIGGGGGDAGMNFNVGVTLAGKDETDTGFAANFAIGGAGGEAGNGAAAKVNNYSDIETRKASSHGIISQSIGGGGGNANFNMAVTYAGSAAAGKPNKNLGFNLAIGGAPGDGGYGGTSDVIQVGNIETFGKESYGILSQSIGGGGGNAGMDLAFIKADGGKAGITIGRIGGIGGHASNVTLSSNGTVTTHGERSFGMLAQSVGNGGGNSSSTSVSGEIPSEEENGTTRPHAMALSVGLEGGIGGYAGNVDLDAAGFVTTLGNNSHAIFAQSVGGGGGNGGSANTFGITAATVSMSLGGVGGQGGYGGIVNVNSSASVRTTGNESIGILAQSIGGGGGNGGTSSTGGTKSGDSGITVAIGGGGGVGMTSGLVTVNNSGIIITGGESSHGVLAQSIGGGGGNGGMAISSIKKSSTEDATRVAVSIGGNGGEGAAGGNVVLTNTGGIGTTKEGSIGLFAQSIGGGGGNGRSVTNNTVIGTSGNNFSVNIGGTGGKGATGGSVTVNNRITADPNSGKIITLENFSHGIAAMSIGGGGGNGSSIVNINRGALTSREPSSAGNVSFSLGGAGGEGGTGGLVNVLNEGSITTYGFKSHGILAQSVGGGGGNGGTSYSGDLAFSTKAAPASGKVGVFSIGGFGGDGNRSGDVVVTNSGVIEVFGDKSNGIYAQSVGGGGGDGGFAMALSRNSLKNPKTDLAASLMTMALGGLGGTGADSGNVTVNHTGSIISHGNDSYGIFAQTVGGGGGNAAHSISSPAWTAANLAFTTLLGGGSTGTAGTVTINTTGSIAMLGANSMAQFAQSVNGGGGNVDLFLDVSKQAVAIGDDGIELPDNSGDVDKVRAFVKSGITLGTDTINGAIGSAIDATHVGDLYTEGKNSIASLIQSIGGGGGNAAQEIVVDTTATVDLELALGAKNSSNNSGGNITQTRTGSLATTGANSLGGVVQSIGGGGGNLTVRVQAIPDATAPTSSAALLTTAASLGADGGSANDGGDLVINATGDVSTTGDRSYGLIYQSIGGGGGKLDVSGFDALDLSFGGLNGATGNGGDIQLVNDGFVATTGNRSNGIVIQSIGGGGGALFSDITSQAISLTLNSDNSGDGGNISFTQTGDIMVSGTDSIGIVAQSIGGGGGIVDRLFAGTAGGVGTSGNVTLDLQGNIVAAGNNGSAVLAQSLAADGQGNITITLADDKTAYAGTDGTVIEFSGGAENTFMNFGTVIGADGLTTMSTRGGSGDEFIDNYGVFYGQFDLGEGANRFLNEHDALLVAGPDLKLGDSANTLTNSGIISPSDTGLAQRTAMTGSLVQNADGAIQAELDFGTGILDGFDLTGSAKLAGEVRLALLNPQLIKSGDFRKDLITGTGGVTDDGMALITAPSIVVQYDLTYDTGTAAALEYSVDFGGFGQLGRNLTEVGNYFNRIQNAGSSPALADTIIKLVYAPTMEDYRFYLSQLAPDFYGEQQAQMIRSSQRFAEILSGGGRNGSASVVDGRMIWFDYEYGESTHDGFDEYKTVDQNSNRYTFGIQQEFRPNWIAGMAFGYEDINSSGYEGRWRSEGTTQQLGATIKTSVGATKIAGIVAYNWSSSDSNRSGDVTGPFETDVTRDLDSFTALLRFSQDYKYEDTYLSPIFDVGYTRLMAHGATETGGGATSLVLQDYNENHVWIRPAVQVGTYQGLGNGLTLHAHAQAGLQYYLTEAQTNVVAGFSGAPGGVDPMDTPINLGTNTFFNLGLDLSTQTGVTFGIGYTRQIDKDFSQDVWNMRLTVPF